MQAWHAIASGRKKVLQTVIAGERDSQRADAVDEHGTRQGARRQPGLAVTASAHLNIEVWETQTEEADLQKQAADEVAERSPLRQPHPRPLPAPCPPPQEPASGRGPASLPPAINAWLSRPEPKLL